MMNRVVLPALKRARDEAGRIELCAPQVGLWRQAPPLGAVIQPGMRVGVLEVLGALFDIQAPAGATGHVVVGPEPGRARVPVQYGDRLVVLDPTMTATGPALPASSSPSPMPPSKAGYSRPR